MKTIQKEPFAPNLSFTEIVMRHYMMMGMGILAGVLHAPLLMLLAFPFFFTGILGWCPVYEALGINHHK